MTLNGRLLPPDAALGTPLSDGDRVEVMCRSRRLTPASTHGAPQGATSTPRQNATRPVISRAASLGSG